MVDDDLIVATVPVCPECGSSVEAEIETPAGRYYCKGCKYFVIPDWAVRRSEVAPDVQAGKMWVQAIYSDEDCTNVCGFEVCARMPSQAGDWYEVEVSGVPVAPDVAGVIAELETIAMSVHGSCGGSWHHALLAIASRLSGYNGGVDRSSGGEVP